MFTSLRHEISTSRVFADLRKVLDDCNWHVEVNGESVRVDEDRFELVARSCHTYECDMSFGDHYRVLVAVGGIRTVAHGIPEAQVCFATLWYSPALALITIDFSKQIP